MAAGMSFAVEAGLSVSRRVLKYALIPFRIIIPVLSCLRLGVAFRALSFTTAKKAMDCRVVFLERKRALLIHLRHDLKKAKVHTYESFINTIK